MVGKRDEKSGYFTVLFDVRMDKRRGVSTIDFEVFGFSRHVVEGMGWKTLEDAIMALKE